jgi:hypothetical protein
MTDRQDAGHGEITGSGVMSNPKIYKVFRRLGTSPMRRASPSTILRE